LIIVSTHYQSISNWLFPQRTILIEWYNVKFEELLLDFKY
jgi:hypothetical protein